MGRGYNPQHIQTCGIDISKSHDTINSPLPTPTSPKNDLLSQQVPSSPILDTIESSPNHFFPLMGLVDKDNDLVHNKEDGERTELRDI